MTTSVVDRPVDQSGAAALLIAMVLPQFHPIPENDAWWGKGFTEWTNVVKARPRFPGHQQPHLPSELGFYDLRLPEARAAQAQLAAEHGIGGFCYYHYWFNGRRLLHKPVDDILNSRQPDFPFCLCWANESWSRTWDGEEREILMPQHYSPQDDDAHIDLLLQFFADPRYIRLGGKPLFVVYKAGDLPEPRNTFDRWRTRAIQAGIGELCLAQFEPRGAGTAPNPRHIGLDFSVEFAPDWRSLGQREHVSKLTRAALKLGLLPGSHRRPSVFEYSLMIEEMLAKADPPYPYVRCVSPGFDNTPRRSTKGLVLRNNRPAVYQQWLQKAIAWAGMHDVTGRRLVFINAWNEWAEGNHLEPDVTHGRAFLEATHRAWLASFQTLAVAGR